MLTKGPKRAMQERGEVLAAVRPVNSVVLLTTTVPLLCIATIVNAIIITVTLSNRRLRTLRNIPLVSLALADMLVGSMVGPFFLTGQLSNLNGQLCTTYVAMETFFFSASLTNMFVVAIERCIAIFKPLKYKKYIRPSIIWSMITIAWIIPSLLAISAPKFKPKIRSPFCELPFELTRVFSTLSAVFFVILSLIMVVMQIKMYLVVKSHRRRIVPALPRGSSEYETTIGISSVDTDEAENTSNTIGNETRGSSSGITFSLAHGGIEIRRGSTFSGVFVTEESGQRERGSVEIGLNLPRTAQQAEDYCRADRVTRQSVCAIYQDREKAMRFKSQSSFSLPRLSRTLAIKLPYRPTQFASFLYLTFILAWAPFVTVVLLRNFGYFNRNFAVYHVAMVTTKILVMANSLLNPLVHTVRMREFRKALCCTQNRH